MLKEVVDPKVAELDKLQMEYNKRSKNYKKVVDFKKYLDLKGRKDILNMVQDAKRVITPD